ncbi:Cdc23 [Penicillium verhagenii]|uniref:Cdc23 n=1 Tax=Penicillium verhagenii TaxID=1562060 RepID=UPI0025457855|nr:Cdc23 [Penicillium verhagenii]KAJ5947978.1 Cdc23 [Penicillium verhagenii]
MEITEEVILELRYRFEESAIKCSERCLYQSSKWAAEMLDSILPLPVMAEDSDLESPMDISDPPLPPPNPYLGAQDPIEAAMEARESHKYLLAKSYFDTREYDRCAAVFLPPTTPPVPCSVVSSNLKSKQPPTSLKGKEKASPFQGSKGQPRRNPYPKVSQKSLFLALYAKFLAGEKRKDEETEMVLGPADGGMAVNRELPDLARGLEGWLMERSSNGLDDQGQGWLEYLYAIVSLKGRNEELATKWLLKSVHLNPFHWGAWQELGDLLANNEDLKQIVDRLPKNLMTLIFHTYSSQELYQTTPETYRDLGQLQTLFPTNAFLQTQEALLYYHDKDFDKAAEMFHRILATSPHRLDSLDHYSNILYVMGARPQLAFVAQIAIATDKFRPETCCVVGNYYSLKSEHEKAVMYFRRALTLDRNFLSAWTLMGHEYIEMKNTHTAIESYRRAVDVNRKDYRAWYGLGQAYEVLDMSFYALFYYQRAAALQPYDPKMWQAVGSCYAKMGRVEQSIQALKRALVAGAYYAEGASGGASPGPGARKILDTETLHQIATLYERLGDEEEASAYMELTLQQESGGAPVNEEANSDEEEYSSASEHATHSDDNENSGDDGDDAPRRRRRKSRPRTSSFAMQNDDSTAGETWHHGSGPTATTSRARLWLAQHALRNGDLDRADLLAGELCQDGFEVEEARALMSDVRARREDDG